MTVFACTGWSIRTPRRPTVFGAPSAISAARWGLSQARREAVRLTSVASPCARSRWSRNGLRSLGAMLDQPALERARRQRRRGQEALHDVAAELGQHLAL